jgi:hypothetical protein
LSDQPLPDIPLPSAWAKNVKSTVLHVISLTHYAIVAAHGWAANSINARVRLAADNDRLNQDNQLLREELRIKDARIAKLEPRRPHYPATERMSILELKAARGWSLAQAARAFLVEDDTIASWLKRIDEDGSSALVQLREPVNKFPDFVRYVVQRLKTLCPALGKVKIAQILARAGLHLGITTVGWMLKAKDKKAPPSKSDPAATAEVSKSSERVVTAKRPNHVWHVDLTAVPLGGFWVPWQPFALPQCWPFCWWLAVVVDHFSRRVMGIAIIERFIRTLKDEGLRRILVPLTLQKMRAEADAIIAWYNTCRPHTALGGRTPDERYRRVASACRRPRWEPRPHWPSESSSASPQVKVRGKPGVNLQLVVDFHQGRKHLPVVTLRQVA